jgi:hypothetical protein
MPLKGWLGLLRRWLEKVRRRWLRLLEKKMVRITRSEDGYNT